MNSQTHDLIAVVEGRVQHGDRRGRTLGFPTVNVRLPDAAELDGVYAGTCQVGLAGGSYIAAVSISNRPTFHGTDGLRLLEAHLLNFEGDLYDEQVRVELRAALRPNRKFDNPASLARQLRRDLADTRSWAVANGLSHLLGRSTNRFPPSARTERNRVRNVPVVRRKTGRGAARSAERRERRKEQVRQALDECIDKEDVSPEWLAEKTGLPVEYIRSYLRSISE